MRLTVIVVTLLCVCAVTLTSCSPRQDQLKVLAEKYVSALEKGDFESFFALFGLDAFPEITPLRRERMMNDIYDNFASMKANITGEYEISVGALCDSSSLGNGPMFLPKEPAPYFFEIRFYRSDNKQMTIKESVSEIDGRFVLSRPIPK